MRVRRFACRFFVCSGFIFVFFPFFSCNEQLPVKSTTTRNDKVEIKTVDGAYRFFKNGTSFLVKGAVGHTKIAELEACGGNTLSTWDTTMVEKILDEALKHHVFVIVGLDMPSGDAPQFYTNEKKVNELFNAHRATVNRFKNHPSLLAWGLGNELIMPINSGSSSFYKTYNRLLKMMHTEDPNHPVTTTLINLQKSSILNIRWKIRDLDFISVNAYNKLKDIKKLLTIVSVVWRGPYLISDEFAQWWLGI